MVASINASTSAGVVTTADTSGILQLQTASTAAVTIDASQNVSIGTTTALVTGAGRGNITLNGSSDSILSFGIAGANTGWLYSSSSGMELNSVGSKIISLSTNTTERVRITSAGDLLLGQTTNSQNYRFVIKGSAGTADDLAFNTDGTKTEIQSFNAKPLYLNRQGNNVIVCSGGDNLLVGRTSTIASEKFSVLQSTSDWCGQFVNSYSGTYYGIRVNSSSTQNNTSALLYDGLDGGNVRFRVYSNGGIANYSANNSNISDQREKKNIELASNYLDKICQIPVKTFLFNDQTDTDLNLGAIAQDVQAVCPELVHESNWANKDEPEKMRLSIYQTDLQYALMKSIQELKAINDTQAETINALTARIVALEGV